jgi:hypothetical protein
MSKVYDNLPMRARFYISVSSATIPAKYLYFVWQNTFSALVGRHD